MKICNFGQKYVRAYPHSYPKSPKPSPNSKNSNFGTKKRVGWSINSRTHFISVKSRVPTHPTSCAVFLPAGPIVHRASKNRCVCVPTVRPSVRPTVRPSTKSGSDFVTRNSVFDLQQPSSVTKSESSVTRSSDRR